MTASVVACGDSAKDWYSVPCDLSIGVNDCIKHGHDTDYLVLVNSPLAFQPNRKNNMQNRLEVINKAKPKRVFIHNRNWRAFFRHAEMIRMREFHGNVRQLRKDLYYSSKTSPFVAISIAYSFGATNIILWGIDFLNHQYYSAGKKMFDFEIGNYLNLFKGLEKAGVKVYIGDENTVFKKHLPLYQ